MITKVASKVAKMLVDCSAIDDTEQELYTYGFFITISQILYFIIIIIFGNLLNIVLESVIFYIAFQIIRTNAGGIHASSELKCEIATTVSIFFCLLYIRLCEINNIQISILIISTVATVFIFFLWITIE